MAAEHLWHTSTIASVRSTRGPWRSVSPRFAAVVLACPGTCGFRSSVPSCHCQRAARDLQWARQHMQATSRARRPMASARSPKPADHELFSVLSHAAPPLDHLSSADAKSPPLQKSLCAAVHGRRVCCVDPRTREQQGERHFDGGDRGLFASSAGAGQRTPSQHAESPGIAPGRGPCRPSALLRMHV